MQIMVTDAPTKLPDFTPEGYQVRRSKGVSIECLPGNEHSFFIGFSPKISFTGPTGGLEVVPGNTAYVTSPRYITDGAALYLICKTGFSAVVGWDVL